jgi:hypothetical protein
MSIPFVPAVDNAWGLVIAHKKLELDGHMHNGYILRIEREIQYEARLHRTHCNYGNGVVIPGGTSTCRDSLKDE